MTGTGGAKADYLSAGRALEQNRDWSAAIDAYLKARGAAAFVAMNTDTTLSLYRSTTERPRFELVPSST